MTRRRGRPGRKRKAEPHVACRALVPVDSKAIRKKNLANCRRARTTFEKAERELEHFETELQPAFEQWRRDTFGPKLQEIARLEERIRELDTKLEMLEYIMIRTGCDRAEAMDLLEEGFREPEPEPEPDSEAFREAREALEESFREMEEGMEELEEALATALKDNKSRIRHALKHGIPRESLLTGFLRTFSEKTGLTEEEAMMFFPREKVRRLLEEAGLIGAKNQTSRTENDSESHKRVRIKKLMREMAFALHPDHCGDHDPKKLDLWHRVQVAAEAKDLDELEVLHAHMQLLTGDISPGVSVARLMDLTQMFRRSRAAIRRQLKRFRDSPAWVFHRKDPRERAHLERSLARTYREDLHLLKEQLRDLEREWKKWTRAK